MYRVQEQESSTQQCQEPSSRTSAPIKCRSVRIPGSLACQLNRPHTSDRLCIALLQSLLQRSTFQPIKRQRIRVAGYLLMLSFWVEWRKWG
ncbi:hypothetical protein QOT17_018468 [Balamuthia mandrillaris]